MVDLYRKRFSSSVSDIAERQAATTREVPEGLHQRPGLWDGGRRALHWELASLPLTSVEGVSLENEPVERGKCSLENFLP